MQEKIYLIMCDKCGQKQQTIGIVGYVKCIFCNKSINKKKQILWRLV